MTGIAKTNTSKTEICDLGNKDLENKHLGNNDLEKRLESKDLKN